MKKEYTHNLDCLNNYIRSIKLFAPYDAEQNRECALRIRAGDENAKKEMVEHNLLLVITIAQKTKTFNLDCGLMELISAGNLGLLKAVERYDPERRESFSTYAAYLIRTAISQQSYTNDGMSRCKRADLYTLYNFKIQFYEKYQRYPTQDECCKELGWTLRRLRTTDNLKECTELDKPVICNDERLTWKELISDQNINVSENYETKHLLKTIDDYIKKCGVKHEYMVYQSVILEGRTLEDVSGELGISRQRVNQIQHNVAKKIKRILDKELLTDDY